MSHNIAVLYNADEACVTGLAQDSIAVAAVAACAEAVETSIHDNGWHARLVALRAEPRELVRALHELEADLVFNLVESFAGDARKESAVVGLLELFGMPFTGSGSRSLAACLEKPWTRALLAGAGVRVPRGQVFEDAQQALERLRFPLIVKPSHEDASHGIARESVVHDDASLRERVRFVLEHYAQPALVEEFIDGREFNLSLLEREDGLVLLSPGEIDFSRFAPGVPHVVTYAGKWIDGSEDWNATLSVGARALSTAELAELEGCARAAWRALDLRDYARVDLRMDREGRAFVIDVNPNPDISPDAGYTLAAARNGIGHAELVGSICRHALRRHAATAASR